MELTLLYQCWIIILVPSTRSHGANSVVSMLDHYFSTHSLKESVHYCHADNCLVKARIGLSLVTLLGLVLIVWIKTRIGLSLVTLLGLVLTGKHTQIHLSFMEVSRPYQMPSCWPFWKSYRRMDCDALETPRRSHSLFHSTHIPKLYTG